MPGPSEPVEPADASAPGPDPTALDIRPAKTPDLMLHLLRDSFDPLELGTTEADLRGGDGLYIVQFDCLITAENKLFLEEMGTWLMDYLPHNAFSAFMDPETAAEVSRLPWIRWVGMMPDDARTVEIQDELAQLLIADAR